MSDNGNISEEQIARLGVISYPDPVLRRPCRPITEFGDYLQPLVSRMWELMHGRNGVGLACPQVGLDWRLFVWNPAGVPEQDQVCINPRLEDLAEPVEAEEGCLSIDGVTVKVRRARTARIVAQGLDGHEFSLEGADLIARIWQHECDHLDGRLILDYMSSAEEVANRRAIKDLEAKYRQSTRKTRK